MFATVTLSVFRRQRQFDDEPRAGPSLLGRAVCRPNPPAKPFRDLPRNGKPQSGITPESVIDRSFRVEAVEDRLKVFGRNSRTLVFHSYASAAVAMFDFDTHCRVVRTEGHGIVNEVAEYLSQPFVLAQDHCARRHGKLKQESDPAP